jgi:TonB family protein
MPIILAQAAPPPAAVAPAQRVSVITQPDWLARPSAKDLTELYPKDAAKNKVEGSATIKCTVDASGALVNCSAIAETPPGAGFGAAAVAMSAKFKMRPMSKDGAPVSGGTVRTPIRFVLPKQSIPSLDLATTCYGYAAAEAERYPGSPQVWSSTIAWSALMAAWLEPAKLRPSEFEAKLRDARNAAAPLLDGDVSKQEREQCAALLDPGTHDLTELLHQ